VFLADKEQKKKKKKKEVKTRKRKKRKEEHTRDFQLLCLVVLSSLFNFVALYHTCFLPHLDSLT
jgi:hypothetical protein